MIYSKQAGAPRLGKGTLKNTFYIKVLLLSVTCAKYFFQKDNPSKKCDKNNM